MRKLLLLIIKYIPIMQMIGMLLNNILYYFDINRNICYSLDFILGNSIIATILIIICSYTFKFCLWHRLIILANVINLIIANIDAIIGINVSDITLLIIYHFVAIIFIILSTILHLKKKIIDMKIETLRKLLVESIANIDAGNSNLTEDEMNEIVKDLTKLNRGIKRISKRYACERILHCSAGTFDNYIKIGLIPKGTKEYGHKELSWSEKDFDEATMYRIKEYKRTH